VVGTRSQSEGLYQRQEGFARLTTHVQARRLRHAAIHALPGREQERCCARRRRELIKRFERGPLKRHGAGGVGFGLVGLRRLGGRLSSRTPASARRRIGVSVSEPWLGPGNRWVMEGAELPPLRAPAESRKWQLSRHFGVRREAHRLTPTAMVRKGSPVRVRQGLQGTH
jgi:hypothetical protein